MKKLLLLAAMVAPMALYAADAEVSVYPEVGHKVGEITKFDRAKYVVMHSTLTNRHWCENPDAFEHLIVDCDTYMGRDNGVLGGHFKRAKEDPNRKGYADSNSIKELGEAYRQTWATQYKDSHKYDDHSDVMVGGMPSWVWPGEVPNHPKGPGLQAANGEAAGEFMGQFLNYGFRKEGESVEMGQRQPKYLEVMNEPMWIFVDDPNLKADEKVAPIEIFKLHNDVARGVRKYNKDVMIGGYTTAFPWLDLDNFNRWNQRLRLFIDVCGEEMDFFSLHFYDFNRMQLPEQHEKLDGIKLEKFRGGHIEATLDIMEQYSYLRLGEVKPFAISEYGGRNHQIEHYGWSHERDWVFLKSFSPMMMSFMDRPNKIVKTVPFLLTDLNGKDGVSGPYPWRMFRHADEPETWESEELVFTDMILFYEFWADLNGERIAIESTNPDVMSDAYLDGDKLYVVLHNLHEQPVNVDISLLQSNLKPRSITARELKWSGEKTVIEQTKLSLDDSYSISKDGTVIIEYKYAKDVELKDTQIERKYYSESYLLPILADRAIHFQINNVDLSAPKNKGVLRLSFGRAIDTSRRPKVTVNGTEVFVPDNYMGDDQESRGIFFGMLEIPIDGELLQQDNDVTITFDDTDGYVAALTMQTFSTQN